MLSFKEFSAIYPQLCSIMLEYNVSLEEAIIIKAKNTNPNRAKQIEQERLEDNIINIGSINNKDVYIKDFHLSQPRPGDSTPRRGNLSNNDILNIIKKNINKLPNSGKFKLIYLNQQKKYDCMIFFITNQKIQVNTIIIGNRINPVYDTKDELPTAIVN
jgi:hypothetical protein